MNHTWIKCAVTAGVVMVSQASFANTSGQEFEAMAKIISLSKDVPAGEVAFAVVYDPASATSVSDKDHVASIIGDGYKLAGHTFKFVAVEADSIGSISAPIVFMTAGLSAANQKSALANAKSRKAITMTTDLPAVKSGNCVIGVDVSDAVSIMMHGGAYQDSGLKFDAAFEFMVKEI